MDKQEIFNKVAVHLLTQKAQAGRKEGDAPFACLYRAPDGKKCAAGCLITDEAYIPYLEQKTVTSEVVTRALIKSGVFPDLSTRKYRDRRDMLAHLQSIHDGTLVSNWKNALLNIGELNGLYTSVVKEFNDWP